MRALLISVYDLGHQPFGLGSAAAWLEASGWTVRLLDLAVQRLDESEAADAAFVGFYLPMHTATRLAVPLIRKLRSLNASAHFCAFGLYAPLNAEFLEALGIDSVIGGEFEPTLVEAAAHGAGWRNGDGTATAVSLAKQSFKLPARSGLPPLSSYAYLTMPDGSRKQVGYTEATRGCKHLCRHCPVVPVYDGRFFIVQRDVVLGDVRQQVAAGAQHISFGDPDFFNGPGHALAIVETLHDEFPDLTYDVTIKVEHLLKHADALPVLRRTGCLLVTSAVEAVDDFVLERLAKGHTRAEFVRALDACRKAGLNLNPTFVAFTPWLTVEGYCELLRTIEELDLIDSVAPVQLAIRLLVPAGSRLLELAEIHELVGPFDQEALYYPWAHPDPRMDRLHAAMNDLVQGAESAQLSRRETFKRIRDLAYAAAGIATPSMSCCTCEPSGGGLIPQMSEPWYCCAEPTARQRDSY
jgi:radical SAM superfamily enzyme YgiQ (UPF0313 family)